MPQQYVIWVKQGATLKVVKDDSTNPVVLTTTVSEYQHYASIAAADAAIVTIHATQPALVMKSGNPSAPPPQPW